MNSSSQQVITAELRDWIVSQARAGCKPEEVLESMRRSGWDETVALAAMEESLLGFLDDQRAQSLPEAARLPAAVPVPEPDLTSSPAVVSVAGHEVRILLTMRLPRLIVLGGLLSDAECDALMAAAGPRLARSETVENNTGGSEVNASRTSSGMFFERAENEICDRIEKRIAALVRWPVENGEGLQVLRYRPGAEYKPHNDYFDTSQTGTPRILERGGQRVGTLVMYLNTPEKGGATVFPDVEVDVSPIKGNAVFFSYDRAHAITKTLHGGTPVIAGEKWVATKWLREREFR
jgi:prolyl 4-hydroxylase